MHNWLTSQETGAVTPHRLQDALNRLIFPELNIHLKKTISECTAHHWMIKLGWHQTIVRKGVYMDGHECEDVMDYQNGIFLPEIAQLKAWMARHKGPELKKIMPELQEGQH